MKEILEKIENNMVQLLKVKTIVTLGVLAVFMILALRGDLSTDHIMAIITMVFAFYFGTQHGEKNNK